MSKSLRSSKYFLLIPLMIAVAEGDSTLDDPENDQSGNDLISNRPG